MPSIAKAIAVGTAKTIWDFHLEILGYGVSSAKSKWITPQLKLHRGSNKTSNFLTVRLYKKHILPVWKRATHAPSE